MWNIEHHNVDRSWENDQLTIKVKVEPITQKPLFEPLSILIRILAVILNRRIFFGIFYMFSEYYIAFKLGITSHHTT